MKKFAFTLPEIVVSMVVMAIVAAVAIPITKDKLSKVDYATYYLGYRIAQTISTDILPNIFKQIDEENADTRCVQKINGTCYTTSPFRPTPVSNTACNQMLTDGYNIKYCPYINDYWAGAVKACGGRVQMPTKEQLMGLANYLYNTNNITSSSVISGLTLDTTKSTALGFPSAASQFSIWSSEDDGTAYAYNAYLREFQPANTFANPVSRASDSSTIWAICVDGEAQEFNPTSTLQQSISSTLTKSDENNTATTTIASVQTAAATETGNFSSLKPHVILSNGVKIYIGSDYGEIDTLNDSVDEMDREGFIIYIDVDGSNNRTRLYEDVYPFYLVKSGKVIPGFKDGTKAGANNAESLAFNLHADKFDASGNRLAKLLNAVAQGDDDPKSFRAVACSAGYVTSTKYCGVDPKTITMEGINCHTSETADCRIKVKAPIRILN